MRGQTELTRKYDRVATRLCLGLLVGLFGAGCQTFSPGPDGSDEPPIGVDRSDVDARTPVHSSVTPVAISGGTLLALSGGRVLVADSERDNVKIVDIGSGQSVGNLQLERGTEPGRAVADSKGRAYVVLRGTGEVLTLDVATGAAGERRKVCASPRGIALMPSGDGLVVACAEGSLIEMPLAGMDNARRIATSQDVRDPVFVKDRLVVSRFRSAELLEFDQVRAPTKVQKLKSVNNVVRRDPFTGEALTGMFEPAVAWRMVPLFPNSAPGSVVIVHQRATTADIAITHPDGSTVNDGPGPGGGDSSSYGGGSSGDISGCGGIVQSAVSIVNGEQVSTSPQLGGVVLPVDVAVSGAGTIAVASAGVRDPQAPSRSAVFAGSIRLFSVNEIRANQDTGDCLPADGSVLVQDQVVAVAFTADKQLVAQTREPAALLVIDNTDIPFAEPRRISLGGDSRLDTGHEIFHRDAGAGLACASCHAEGTDDGRTWSFDPIGKRRTQPLDVNLKGTEPFHWDGSLPTMNKLMNEVFVSRMGGPVETNERVDALSGWIFKLPVRAPIRPVMDVAAERGKALFESAAGCATCHNGAKFTNNETVDVGTGVALQVPSLLGVSQRLPVMHDGCANTLKERFDASCGGNAHGNVLGLKDAEIDDLVAYLESI